MTQACHLQGCARGGRGHTGVRRKWDLGSGRPQMFLGGEGDPRITTGLFADLEGQVRQVKGLTARVKCKSTLTAVTVTAVRRRRTSSSASVSHMLVFVLITVSAPKKQQVPAVSDHPRIKQYSPCGALVISCSPYGPMQRRCVHPVDSIKVSN
jgi:hypothetical protein